MPSLSHVPDHELILLINQEEEQAFTEIYNRYWEKMASYAVRLTKSEEEAADIVQEIFVSIWNRRITLVIKSTLGAYLIRSTRNLCLRYIERNIHTDNFLDKITEQAVDNSLNIEESISLKELQENIDLGIAKLPKKMREVYLLSRDEQLSYREIAEKLNIAEGTVKKQVSNALKIIADSLNGKLSATMMAIFLHLLK
ncbi:RNA polymerase sigma-70 factor [Pedobacter sp. HDW13]|uniref:RNA polymerase sigma factor n=1 Tax=unclassified Pedobacter TaxID=2628915 RepID=UPI000F5AC9D7|nr:MULTISPECIES: RNA polymerase sigma-70 factor [unclassified Pedobacter]QIL42283.1 RNA polymerase sigma-70 factor [Pedobacter sp. HDW13]RQO76475.1 RNA polymerase subunit sigma-70 [Pedobacter sp. KBW01]